MPNTITSDKLLINEAFVVAGTADKASATSSPLSVTSSSAEGAKQLIPDCDVPVCSAKPGPTGTSVDAISTLILFTNMGDELDNILHADGAMGEETLLKPRADCNVWLNCRAHELFPRAKATLPQPKTDDLIKSKLGKQNNPGKIGDMPYTFADIEPVKGVCIASWRNDNGANELESVIEPSCDSPNSVGIVDEIKKLSQAPRLIGGIGHISSITSDTRVTTSMHEAPHSNGDRSYSAQNLRVLISEAQETFHALMERNLALESEVEQLRARLELLEQRQNTRRPSNLTPLPLGSNWSDQSSLNIFDISTPPTYKENHGPRAVSRNTLTHDKRNINPNRQPGHFTVFNS